MEELLINELIDDIDFNVVGELVNNLVQPANLVGPIRIPAIRNDNYYENVIPNYTLEYFKKHFRMSRGTFQVGRA